jgi:hypothetical protein
MPKFKARSEAFCTSTSWQGRDAWVLGNGLVELTVLRGGGHIADFHFTKQSGLPDLNPLWVPPWKTIDSGLYRPQEHARKYGPPVTGKMIAGITGHNLCLDYFGAPSEKEAEHGLSIHGEAPCLAWKKLGERITAAEATLKLGVRLPAAGLKFVRELGMRQGEPVAYFTETVINERKMDHFFHWVEHVTLGPPFLDREGARISVSAKRGQTFPHGYEGKALLLSSRDFQWPLAPGTNGSAVDISQPFSHPGLGFVVTLLLDPKREIEFFAALNLRSHLMIAYCFPRSEFPWMAVWEENKARDEAPWKGTTQARGMEFGSTPFPVGRREAFAKGTLFGAPCFSVIPALGQKSLSYIAFLSAVPEDVTGIDDVRLSAYEILVSGKTKQGKIQAWSVPATRLSRK